MNVQTDGRGQIPISCLGLGREGSFLQGMGWQWSVEQIKGIHEAQLLTYMKLAGVGTGLLMNFNVTKLKSGIKRFVL